MDNLHKNIQNLIHFQYAHIKAEFHGHIFGPYGVKGQI